MTSIGATSQAGKWESEYNKASRNAGRYPTEWVIRTLAGGNYPRLKMDKEKYAGARILDMGCGDGRNLPLLLDLGFDVHACEISQIIVNGLTDVAEKLNWAVKIDVGLNSQLPYADNHFDYLLSCASCYYLDAMVSWKQVCAELARVVKPGGLLVANIPDEANFLFDSAICQEDGSWLITSDPYNLRNGNRMMAAKNEEDLRAMFAPHFKVLSIGHQRDDYFGIDLSLYFFVAIRL